MSVYLPMPQYIASYKQQGFGDDDIVIHSDRLRNALITWGEVGGVV